MGDLCACLAQAADSTLERKNTFCAGTCLCSSLHICGLQGVRAFVPSPHPPEGGAMPPVALEASLSW